MAGARTNTRRMHRLRDEFFDDGRRYDADPATRHLSVCWICKGRIDYTAGAGTTPDSHHLDHRLPVSTHPELQEDPDNFEHAHKACNQERGTAAPTAGLGEEMPPWW